MKNQNILSKMNVEEKINLCCGADFWHSVTLEEYSLPAMTVTDGPHGLRLQAGDSDMLGINDSVPATCFPTAAATGCSWDRQLLGEIGHAIAEEALAGGVGTILGPGLNIKRSPLCGRNFEYISEDPYLTGQLAASYIKQMEQTGVGACPKHFAVNSQEYKRFSSNGHIDERTLREIYLAAFETAVRDGNPSMIMSAYNKINGTYCSDNKRLLTDVLRGEWGFEGLVVTDWGGMHDRVSGFKSGCDWSMPGGGKGHLQAKALAAYRDGRLTEQEIDTSADRMITRVLAAAETGKRKKDYDSAEHHALARRAAAQSAVLMKNDGLLPLKTESVALIGYMAKNPRYQGAGSSHINPTELSSLCSAAPGWSYAPGCDKYGDTDDRLLAEAAEQAEKADCCVVVAGLPESYESEGFDRTDMKMPDGHIRMIKAVADANPNTVVVLLCGSPVELPWLDKVRAVLYMGLPGQAGGEAIADLLKGSINPGGKLAETWPLSYEDVPCSEYYGEPHRDAQYREGVYVGYRYYETAKAPVRFPFGFGLSYTTFEYADLQVKGKAVTLSVSNIGDVAGAEIVQLYIAPPKGGLFRPAKELKGFHKVFLQPGETRQVEFQLDERSLAVWGDGWRVQTGTYEVQAAASARDVRLLAQIPVEGEDIPVPAWQENSWYAAPAGKPSKADFEEMLGRTIQEPTAPRKGQFTDENTIVEMAEYSLLLKIVKYFMKKTLGKMNGGKPDYRDPTFRMVFSCSADCALFGLVNTSSGTMPEKVAHGLLEIANGHFFRGIGLMCKKAKS